MAVNTSGLKEGSSLFPLTSLKIVGGFYLNIFIYILVSEHTCPPTGLAHNDHFQSNVSPRIAPATATINFPHIFHILVGANSSELLRAVLLFPETIKTSMIHCFQVIAPESRRIFA